MWIRAVLVDVHGTSTTRETTARARDPVAAVRSTGRVADVVALLAVPVVLAAVGTLPEQVRVAYAFEYADPTLLTAYTSSFVHFSTTHLVANVALYLLVAPLGYLLAVASGHRRQFLVAATTFLLAFPLVLSLLNLAVPRAGVGGGFSAINAAFAGYVVFALPRYLGWFAPEDDAVRSPWLFFFALAAIAVVAVPLTVRIAGVAVAAALSGVLFLLPRSEGGRLRALKRWVASPGGLELGLFGFGVLAAYPLMAFPASPVVDGAVVNLYAHLLGFALGYMATYVTALVESSVGLGATA